MLSIAVEIFHLRDYRTCKIDNHRLRKHSVGHSVHLSHLGISAHILVRYYKRRHCAFKIFEFYDKLIVAQGLLENIRKNGIFNSFAVLDCIVEIGVYTHKFEFIGISVFDVTQKMRINKRIAEYSFQTCVFEHFNVLSLL